VRELEHAFGQRPGVRGRRGGPDATTATSGDRD
jgi:hypothetical protein